MKHPYGHNLVPDLALLNSLGLRVVVVFGAAPQIDEKLLSLGKESLQNRRIDRETMKTILEVQGAMRSEFEAQFSMGLVNSPMHNARVRCISGNFVQAQPLGVIDGVDMESGGQVRSIDATGINQSLDQKDIVLISATGFSTTGEIFSLSAHEIAVATASAMESDKLIIIGQAHDFNQTKQFHEITVAQGDSLITELTPQSCEYKDLKAATDACKLGVGRCHLIPIDQDGSLLSELFTRDGSGLMVTTEPYDRVRSACIDDVGGILQLLEPLEEKGVLVKRSRELLEQEILHFVVNERDGMIIGCAALYPLDDTTAELGCVAVHTDYRHNNRGDLLLKVIEHNALKQGINQLFVLTTQTAHWFIERGFTSSSVTELPDQKKNLYNYQRNSKVFRLKLSANRK